MNPGERLAMLFAALALGGYGALSIWTYYDHTANDLTRAVERLWKAFRPLAPIDYRKWNLVGGALLVMAGIALLIRVFV